MRFATSSSSGAEGSSRKRTAFWDLLVEELRIVDVAAEKSGARSGSFGSVIEGFREGFFPWNWVERSACWVRRRVSCVLRLDVLGLGVR